MGKGDNMRGGAMAHTGNVYVQRLSASTFNPLSRYACPCLFAIDVFVSYIINMR